MNKSNPHPLSTINAVIDDLLNRMSIDEQQKIAQYKEDEIIKLHVSLGLRIRNEYGLWDGSNQKLLNSCGTTSPDDASNVIIEQLWRALKKTLSPEAF